MRFLFISLSYLESQSVMRDFLWEGIEDGGFQLIRWGIVYGNVVRAHQRPSHVSVTHEPGILPFSPSFFSFLRQYFDLQPRHGYPSHAPWSCVNCLA